MKFLTETTDIENLFLELTNAKILWLDTEVADYKTKKPRLSLIQILADYQEIIPENTYICDVLDKPELIEIFITLIMKNKDIEKVFHNAKYDKQFLGKTQGKNITCTLEMAQKLPYFLLPLSNLKLKTLAEQIGGFTNINKEEQNSDWGKLPLTETQLKYAQMDPIYLAKVHQKLLKLIAEIDIDPTTDNIEKIALRYRKIESQWKLLNSEIEHLKDRAKKAMEAQNIKENSAFKMSSYDRTTVKANLIEIAQMIVNMELESKIELNLTKEMQKDLAQILPFVKIEEEKKTIRSLRIKENEEEADFNF